MMPVSISGSVTLYADAGTNLLELFGNYSYFQSLISWFRDKKLVINIEKSYQVFFF